MLITGISKKVPVIILIRYKVYRYKVTVLLCHYAFATIFTVNPVILAICLIDSPSIDLMFLSNSSIFSLSNLLDSSYLQAFEVCICYLLFEDFLRIHYSYSIYIFQCYLPLQPLMDFNVYILLLSIDIYRLQQVHFPYVVGYFYCLRTFMS